MKFVRKNSKWLVILLSMLAICGAAVGVQGALKLEWVLSGPAIGGVVPSGKAVVGQPSLPGRLQVEVKNVNLPDGTALSMWLGNYFAGTLNLRSRGAKLQSQIPFQFRNGFVEVRLGDTVIMSGRFKN